MTCPKSQSWLEMKPRFLDGYPFYLPTLSTKGANELLEEGIAALP